MLNSPGDVLDDPLDRKTAVEQSGVRVLAFVE
jgi:hypothetical protein